MKLLAFLASFVLLVVGGYWFFSHSVQAPDMLDEATQDWADSRPADIPFDRVGTVVRDNPGLEPGEWYLVYEEPGAPARTVQLRFTGDTCLEDGKKIACMAAALEGGTKARIVGELEIPDTVIVHKIDEIETAE